MIPPSRIAQAVKPYNGLQAVLQYDVLTNDLGVAFPLNCTIMIAYSARFFDKYSTEFQIQLKFKETSQRYHDMVLVRGWLAELVSG